LREVQPKAGADQLVARSVDGMTIGTPLSVVLDGRDAMLCVGMNGEPLPLEHGFPVRMLTPGVYGYAGACKWLTDNRAAMLAVAMNGKPLEIDHGFPVRTIVPGLYGYVSATKWVVDLKVTRFADVDAYWTKRGWSEQGPVKMSSRIDVPGSGDQVGGGDVTFAGMAWSQHTGIEAVHVAIDGGAWLPAEISAPPTNDTWVQWRLDWAATPGSHLLRVRATDKTGALQTPDRATPFPDGATGWHSVTVTVV
jgi:hypothetical protein